VVHHHRKFYKKHPISETSTQKLAKSKKGKIEKKSYEEPPP